VRLSKRRDGRLRLDRLDHEHPVFREVVKAIVETSTTTENIQPSDYEGLNEAIAEIVPEIVVSVGKFLPEGLAKSEAFNPGSQATLFPVSRGRRKEDLAAAIRFCVPRTLDELFRGISQSVANELTRLQYLGPLRSYPPRHLAFSQHHDPNWFAGGGYAWDILRRDADIRAEVNEWLSTKDRLQTPYRLDIRKLIHAEDAEEPLLRKLTELFLEAGFVVGDNTNEQVERLMSALQNSGYLGTVPEIETDQIAERWAKTLADSMETIHELCLIDLRSNTQVSHRDVGIGISQMLPVLVGAYASKNQIIAIEQPEIHLHPALQADLGDVFIQSALGKGKNRFLIETHSEHLLLRIMRRMREASSGDLPDGVPRVRPEDVCVLFVQPKGSSCAVRHLELDEEGQLLDVWPGGFFEEGYRERFA
jgi:hypothetical protein